MPSNKPTLTVTQLNEYIKTLFESDRILASVAVVGEISNFTRHKSGHLYFTVKDDGSAINAVMFRSSADRVRFDIQNGMKIIASGRVALYTKSGQYQIYIDSLVPDGIGSLAMRFEQLKEKLAKEGLFQSEHKKSLPRIPKTVGVITSPTGAAVRDIINVCTRRFPYAKILLYPALVQGDGAEQTLIDGVTFFSLSRCADVVIIGRGGGSIEDLWAFNSEALARAIYDCSVPVISAVGHETDFTICDFVADMRAPTPSAAAELAVPDTSELIRKLSNVENKLATCLTVSVKHKKEILSRLSASYVFKNPERLLDERKLRADMLSTRLDDMMTALLTNKKNAFSDKIARLEALSPLAVLSRGYSAAFSDDKVIKSVVDVNPGDKLKIVVSDGTVYSTVDSVSDGKE